jgi:tRNA 2-selenouridine synthase
MTVARLTALRSFDAARPVYIESESKRWAMRPFPESIAAMRASPCLQIDLPSASGGAVARRP